MTSYLMEAKENYDATRAAQANAGSFPVATFIDAHNLGLGYDAGRRELVYAAVVCKPLIDASHATNTTGHDLWDGQIGVPAGSNFPAVSNFNFFLARKNIDTGAVTFYDAYDPAATVPSAIYGDGTARRYVSDTDIVDEYPILTDPRTHDAWVHQESCKLYVYRAADSWSLHLSPFPPRGDLNNPVLPFGMETDWVYANEFSWNHTPFMGNLYLIPRLTTAAETTADQLLAYATYSFPSEFIETDLHGPPKVWRAAMADDGGFWMLSASSNRRGEEPTPNVKLHRFTKPSAFVYPAAPTDGGFTDETPWTSSTGPNAMFGGLDFNNPVSGRLFIAYSADRVQLNLLYSQYYQEDDAGTATGQIGYTWYNTSTAAWGSSVLASGYVNADFTPATAGSAAFYITGLFRTTNLYLDADNYYSAANYAARYFFVEVYAVSGGVLNTGDSRLILVKLSWNPGAAPTLSPVLDEATTWDPAYTAYGAAISNPRVVWASVQGQSISSYAPDFDVPFEPGLYDPIANAIWWSGLTGAVNGPNIYHLDSTFTARASASGPLSTTAQPPLLRLSLGAAPPPTGRPHSQGYIF